MKENQNNQASLPSSIFKLVSSYQPQGDQPQAIKSLLSGIENGLAYQTLLGVTGSGKTFTMANLIALSNRPALIMVHNKTLAAQLYGEMKEFFPENAVEYFVSYYDYYQPEAYIASSDTFIEKDASINDHIEQMRLSATKAILERHDTIIIATVSAIYGLGDKNHYLAMILHLVTGQQIDQREVLKRLAILQYNRNEMVLERSSFRVRGDIIDIFPAESSKDAIRIELFDDKIEKIHYFDPLTGHLTRKVERVTVYPSNHYVTPRSHLVKMIDQIKEDLRNRLELLRQENRLVEAQRLEQRTLFDLEMMLELGYCSGIENYSRYLSGRAAGEPPPTLFDYLPEDALLFLDESHVTVPQIGAMFRGDRSRKENLVNYGFRLPSAMDNRPLMFEEFEALMPQTIFVSATPSKYEAEHQQNVAEQIVRPTGLLDPEIEVRPTKNQIDDLLEEIKHITQKGNRVLITTLTKKMSENLTDYLSEKSIKVRYLHSDIETVERVEIIRDFRLGIFDVLVGINLLREGLDIPEVALVAILDADKEGFLRSEKSLIQTIGRAARNSEGKAILYADHITRSMQLTIDETNRRRAKQQEYNLRHNITPKTIISKIQDVMKGAREKEVAPDHSLNNYVEAQKSYLEAQTKIKSKKAITQELKNIEKIKELIAQSSENKDQIIKLIPLLEAEMIKHAKNLEFEIAAQLRDQINQLKDKLILE